MNDDQEKQKTKKLAMLLAGSGVATTIIFCIFFVVSGTFTVNVAVLGGLGSLLFGLPFCALIYFWKGPIR